MPEAYLSLESVAKKIAGRDILCGVSFQANRGEILGIAGENGAGKSTLIRILASVLKADRGQFFLDGIRNPQSEEWKRKIAWAPQELALDTDLTVLDNLRFWAALSFQDRREAQKHVRSVQQNPLVSSFLQKRVRDLSGGMARRANLCASLMSPGRLILLDEPFVGADSGSLQMMEDALLQLKREGAAILLCSHDASVMNRLCDRVLLLDGGVIRDGEP